MGYCTLVNSTVSDTSMQYRSSIVIENYKSDLNYKQIPTGYMKRFIALCYDLMNATYLTTHQIIIKNPKLDCALEIHFNVLYRRISTRIFNYALQYIPLSCKAYLSS